MTTLFEFAPTAAVADGSAVPANSAVYDLVDAGVVYDTAIRFEGLTASAECPNAAGTTVRTLEEQFAATSTRRIVRVMRVAALTAGTFVTLTRWRNGAAGIAEVRLTSAGKLSIRDNVTGTLIATASPTVPFGALFRYEVDTVGAQITLRLYLDPMSATPSATLGPFTYSGGTFDQIIDGVGTAAAATTVHVAYAADGDTENPSITRFSPTTPPADDPVSTTVVYDSGGTVEHLQTVADDSFTVVVPAGAEAGDTLFVCLATNSGVATIPTPPAGYTLLGLERINSNVTGWLYAGAVGTGPGQIGAPGATHTFTMDTGGLRTIGAVAVWDGVDLADIIANLATRVASSLQAAAQAAHTLGALTAPEDGSGVQAFWIGRIGVLGTGPTLTPPASHTALQTAQTEFDASPNISVASTRRTATAASGAAIGGEVGTWSATGATGITFAIALPPGQTAGASHEGIRTYLVTAGGEVLLTSTTTV